MTRDEFDMVMRSELRPDPCTTAPNGTGVRCTCLHDCVNYWMRSIGVTVMPEPRKRRWWWFR